MGLEMGNRCWNRLGRWTLVKRRFWLLSAFLSVAVHVMRPPMIVVDANRLPIAIRESQKDDRVALDWRARLAKPDDDALHDSDLDGPLVRHGQEDSQFFRTRRQLSVCSQDSDQIRLGTPASFIGIDGDFLVIETTIF